MYCTTTTKYQNPISKKKNTKNRNWSAVFWVPQAEWTQFQLRNPFKDDFQKPTKQGVIQLGEFL